MRALAILSVLICCSCEHPGHVEYTGGQCMIDGAPATLSEVEARQAKISERVVARQPLSVAVTILIVLLAGASHVEKLILLFTTRRKEAHGLGDRIRNALDRYRAHPIRYFAIVVGTLLLLGAAGGTYVALDAERRADERALGLLQFCHVALRNRQADALLDEQRKNLAAIESTAGNIRSLVGTLPPEEQKKARQIVEQINAALAKQSTLVNDFTARGLTALEGDFATLKGLPASVRELGEELKRRDAAADGKLAAIKSGLDALAARPAPKCPACICEAPRAQPMGDGGQ
jgi:hypothetical protein